VNAPEDCRPSSCPGKHSALPSDGTSSPRATWSPPADSESAKAGARGPMEMKFAKNCSLMHTSERYQDQDVADNGCPLHLRIILSRLFPPLCQPTRPMTASYHLFMKGASRCAVAGMVHKHVQVAMSWVPGQR
jgi:hypothetical protein